MGHNLVTSSLVLCIWVQVAVLGERRQEVVQKNEDILKWEKGEFWCPKRCTCSLQDRIIDCSSLKLKGIPIIPASTERL